MHYPIRKNIDWQQIKRFVIFCSVVIAILCSVGFFLEPILIPVLMSIFFAYLLAPLIGYFDRYPVPRVIVVSTVILLVVSVLAFLTSKIFPLLYTQFTEIVDLVPQAAQTVSAKWIPSVSDFVVGHELMDKLAFDSLVDDSNILMQVSDRVQQAAMTIWRTVPKVFGTMVNLILVPPLTFFLLKDLRVIRRHLANLVPRDLQGAVRASLAGVNQTLRSVIKGQATVAGILSLLYVLGLSTVGLKSAVAIGLVAGICRIVPYLDVVVGGVLSAVVLMSDFTSWTHVSAVVGVFMLVQSIDGMYITPRVVGERVGLHPMAVIISVFAFGDMMGVWGVILAIPVAALAKNLWVTVISYYLGSDAYSKPEV